MEMKKEYNEKKSNSLIALLLVVVSAFVIGKFIYYLYTKTKNKKQLPQGQNQEKDYIAQDEGCSPCKEKEKQEKMMKEDTEENLNGSYGDELISQMVDTIRKEGLEPNEKIKNYLMEIPNVEFPIKENSKGYEVIFLQLIAKSKGVNTKINGVMDSQTANLFKKQLEKGITKDMFENILLNSDGVKLREVIVTYLLGGYLPKKKSEKKENKKEDNKDNQKEKQQ